MAVTVVDASALCALAFDEPDAPAVMQALEGHSLVAPTLLFYEVGNVCWTKCRSNPASAPGLRKALTSILQFDIRLLEIEPMPVLAMAERRDITFYDASYLWLADHLRAQLVTLDRRLQRLIGGPSAR